MGPVSDAFVIQYGDNVMQKAQQKGSRLRNTVTVKTGIVGKSTTFNALGKKTAVKRTSRLGDSPTGNPDHQTTFVQMYDYEDGDLIDSAEELKMLIDPQSAYVTGSAWALGRAMDDELISAARGTAYRGEDGSTSTVLPSAQKITESGTDGFTFTKMLQMVEKFNAADVDPEEERFVLINSKMLTTLLSTTQVTSSDYATIEALQRGKVDRYLGFNWIRTERLPKVGNNRMGIAYTRSGLGLAIAKDITTKMGERADKKFAMQTFLTLGIGAGRLEEEKVVEIQCYEA